VKKCLGLLTLAALVGCDGAFSEQARVESACRAAISYHLVDPPSAKFDDIHVAERSGGQGWFVSVVVSATDGSGTRTRDHVRCEVNQLLQVTDLSD
jgi:hypothetical protein